MELEQISTHWGCAVLNSTVCNTYFKKSRSWNRTISNLFSTLTAEAGWGRKNYSKSNTALSHSKACFGNIPAWTKSNFIEHTIHDEQEYTNSSKPMYGKAWAVLSAPAWLYPPLKWIEDCGFYLHLHISFNLFKIFVQQIMIYQTVRELYFKKILGLAFGCVVRCKHFGQLLEINHHMVSILWN